MPENNQLLSVESQLVGLPLAGPESFSQQQLDYLKRALGVDETVLFNSTAGETGGFTVSETVGNFETIKIVFSPYNAESGVDSFNYGKQIAFFDGPNMAAVQKVAITGIMPNGTATNSLVIRERSFNLDSTGTTFNSGHSHQVYWNGSSWGTGATLIYVYKVVGIHRISGGN